jgi:hypothetical protein
MRRDRPSEPRCRHLARGPLESRLQARSARARTAGQHQGCRLARHFPRNIDVAEEPATRPPPRPAHDRGVGTGILPPSCARGGHAHPGKAWPTFKMRTANETLRSVFTRSASTGVAGRNRRGDSGDRRAKRTNLRTSNGDCFGGAPFFAALMKEVQHPSTREHPLWEVVCSRREQLTLGHRRLVRC